ncbi:hypothetical protein [Wolbachia endosymbiont (group A) of Icerya purchasi]|uniref:hypothetical protein n=1 Tax=Wolbachia endosymbiont (group A) of Icerya purchasi TaxID=2954019 RepID=UPI00222F7562|nr:hypothetical protein [Wolbachia endosymbiont (group A) of Icerya purchasi]
MPALAVTSACVFSINFIAVKTLKKVIKQRKLAAKHQEAETKEESTVAELENPKEEIQDVSIKPVSKENSEQISKDLHQ